MTSCRGVRSRAAGAGRDNIFYRLVDRPRALGDIQLATFCGSLRDGLRGRQDRRGPQPVPFAGQAGKCGDVDGPAGQAQLAFPRPPVADSEGNLYLAQTSTIRKVTPDGTVSTFAGRAGQVGNRLGVLPGMLGTIGHLWISADDVLHVVAGEALLKIPTR